MTSRLGSKLGSVLFSCIAQGTTLKYKSEEKNKKGLQLLLKLIAKLKLVIIEKVFLIANRVVKVLSI